MFLLYSLLYSIVFILVSPMFFLRRQKYAAGFSERLGKVIPLAKAGNPVIWFHCVSVGEVNAARPLIDGIRERFPAKRIVVSTTTATGQKLARSLFGDFAAKIFYFPFDWNFAVRRTIRKIRPEAIIILETEIWINFLREAHSFGAKIFLVNGRLSRKSASRYSWIKGWMSHVSQFFELILVQDDQSAMRFVNIGFPKEKIEVTGNLKFDQVIENGDLDLSREFSDRFGLESPNTCLIVAASTHDPEEKIILGAFQIARKSLGMPLRLLIAPRHPERFDGIGQIVEDRGFNIARRSYAASETDRDAEVILLDTIGELRSVYTLAKIVFVGGSLIPHGGQNILEPAIFGATIITGAYTHNFEAIVQEFVRENAILQLPSVKDDQASQTLADAFQTLVIDDAGRSEMGKKAELIVRKNGGATTKTIDLLTKFL